MLLAPEQLPIHSFYKHGYADDADKADERGFSKLHYVECNVSHTEDKKKSVLSASSADEKSLAYCNVN